MQMIETDAFGLAAIVHYRRQQGLASVRSAVREAGLDLPEDALTEDLLSEDVALASEIDGPHELPLAQYFQEYEKLDVPTRRILEKAFSSRPTGSVLDIGCGSGRFLKVFRDRAYNTLGIDVSPCLVWVCRHRGLGFVNRVSIDDLEPDFGRFDIILLLGHNLGIVGTPDRVRQLLKKCSDLLTSGGLLLVNSIDITASEEAYARNRVAYNSHDPERHVGQTVYRVQFGSRLHTPTFVWIHVKSQEIEEWAEPFGLKIIEVFEDSDSSRKGHWSGVLQKIA